MRTWRAFPVVLAVLFLAPHPGRAAAGGEEGRHTLWAVAGGRGKVHLMGSLHLMSPESYPLAGVLESAYRESERIVFETDLAAVNSTEHAGMVLAEGLLLDGSTIADSISPESMSLLEARARAAGLPMGELRFMKPWLCSVTIALRSLEGLGLDANYGVDMHFYLRARTDGKEMLFLESPEFQARLMSSLAEADQENLLRQTLLESEVMAAGFDEMYDAWEKGDVATLAGFLQGGMEDFPGLRERFLVARNREWVLKIEELLDNTASHLVIVGAGHLVGRDSVVELLEKRGWKVRQL